LPPPFVPPFPLWDRPRAADKSASAGFRRAETPVKTRFLRSRSRSAPVFPQRFPQLWKSWGRNRRSCREVPPRLEVGTADCSTRGLRSERRGFLIVLGFRPGPERGAVRTTVFRGTDGESEEGQAHISAEHPPAGENPRFPGTNVDEERPDRAEAPARQGAQAADGRGRRLALDESLPRTARVRRRPDFERAYDTGARIHGRFMTVFVVSNGTSTARLGIAATRKMGGAVERNRAKRLARELFRRRRPDAGLDVIIVPRREMLDAPFSSLESDYHAALDRRDRASVRPARHPPRRGPRGPRPRVASSV
jgi:ribonuclease P protein component